MKAWFEGSDRFDDRNGHAKGSRTPLEDSSASATPGRVRFFRKDQAPDTLAAMTAGLAADDYQRLGQQLLIDSIPSLWAVTNDPPRLFGHHGVGHDVLGEVAVSEGEVTTTEAPLGGEAIDPSAVPFADLIVVDQEAIRETRVIDGSSGVVPLGDDFRIESMHSHMYGGDFPPTNQLGNDL